MKYRGVIGLYDTKANHGYREQKHKNTWDRFRQETWQVEQIPCEQDRRSDGSIIPHGLEAAPWGEQSWWEKSSIQDAKCIHNIPCKVTCIIQCTIQITWRYCRNICKDHRNPFSVLYEHIPKNKKDCASTSSPFPRHQGEPVESIAHSPQSSRSP